MNTVAEDLADRLAMLNVRCAVVFGVAVPGPPREALLLELEQGLRAGLPEAVTRVRGAVDPGELGRPDFWGTPLGQLLFSAGGYGRETCSQMVAAGVLGCSRQWVSAMVAEGKLTPTFDRSVYVREVLEVLKRRTERLSLDGSVK